MPLYTVTTKQALDAPSKQRIVNGITDTHCAVTLAPAMFVQVIFSFGIELRKGCKAHVLGSIRSGRSDDVKARLKTAFAKHIAEAMSINADLVQTELLDVPANCVIEGGAIMPEPGEEAAWLESYYQRYG
ncbi:hypothetical protein OE749_01705 [Aestuariibacter sp. AA17]|uniref:Tautomerase cis-CaaD-like domain-containing protein n=1 Tax=Fluctibacter corallii TaxID=2984329 RepID=A0ABT3A486_9ALTE|nr:hypothetical protein [Aestuariibacter sp. AA17]MCV2883412.1 hypothetical protein [Aestuariibacter sp. AA17]